MVKGVKSKPAMKIAKPDLSRKRIESQLRRAPPPSVEEMLSKIYDKMEELENHLHEIMNGQILIRRGQTQILRRIRGLTNGRAASEDPHPSYSPTSPSAQSTVTDLTQSP